MCSVSRILHLILGRYLTLHGQTRLSAEVCIRELPVSSSSAAAQGAVGLGLKIPHLQLLTSFRRSDRSMMRIPDPSASGPDGRPQASGCGGLSPWPSVLPSASSPEGPRLLSVPPEATPKPRSGGSVGVGGSPSEMGPGNFNNLRSTSTQELPGDCFFALESLNRRLGPLELTDHDGDHQDSVEMMAPEGSKFCLARVGREMVRCPMPQNL